MNKIEDLFVYKPNSKPTWATMNDGLDHTEYLIRSLSP